VRVNQVSVNMGFTLTGANGRIISNTDASSASYAGADVANMALTLVNEQADEVVSRLLFRLLPERRDWERKRPRSEWICCTTDLHLKETRL
jgi:hypothetical protein